MRTLFVMAALVATAAVADDAATIEPQALAARLKQNDPALVILDVRSPKEFAAGHVPGAINIPHDQLPARVTELPEAAAREIVAYCETGVRTRLAIDRLQEQGYSSKAIRASFTCAATSNNGARAVCLCNSQRLGKL